MQHEHTLTGAPGEVALVVPLAIDIIIWFNDYYFQFDIQQPDIASII
jgi:hypothetical protein